MTTEEVELYMKQHNVDKKTAIVWIIEDLKDKYKEEEKREQKAYDDMIEEFRHKAFS